MVLSETRGLRLSWVIRRGIGLTRRLSATQAHAYRRLGCSPSNPSVSRTDWPPPEQDRRRWTELFSETLKRLVISVFLRRNLSFFPKCQRNRCDLASQREACHGGLDAFGERGLVEVLERAGTCTRGYSGSFK